MNILYLELLLDIKRNGFINQRQTMKNTGFSLGYVNKGIKNMIEQGYLDRNNRLTEKANSLLMERKPKRAIILAAGIGMRMVPINNLMPKALLEINGESLIERLINQLIEVGINNITIVVGFMKESFEYLIDKYNVELVINNEYYYKNSLSSLAIVADKIENTYIVPCDVWSLHNPFNSEELYSWYMVTNKPNMDSNVVVNRKNELVKTNNKSGNRMIGIAYLTNDSTEYLKKQLTEYSANDEYNDCFWEEALFKGNKMIVQAKTIEDNNVTEINTYEQLRELDSKSNQLNSDAINTISEQLKCKIADIIDIKVLKKGMTNRSFIFTVNNERYIMRIPGEGTDRLINRKEEKEVYDVISGKELCDDPVYINPVNGYKITKYIENVRCCDPNNIDDLRRCMQKLRFFHDKKLKVNHVFDIFEKIDFYESLWNGRDSIYRDYKQTKEKVFELKVFVEKHKMDYQLTHIDAVPDNFLFDPNSNGELSVQLTDWEYSGMQDPHVDIAMFIIYSLYKKEEADRLIDIYFESEGGCDITTRAMIYCYIAMCGLLWSNWCEYKRQLGVEFGEYSIKQYRYAKDYYKYAKEIMND